MTKRVGFLIIVLLAITSMLFGCGKTPAENNAATNAKPESTNQAAAKKTTDRTQNGWEKIPAPGNSTPGLIGIGANGAVWVAGKDDSFYEWKNNGWVKSTASGLPDGAGVMNLAVDNNGFPWITTVSNEIYRMVNNNWEKLPGKATDISFSMDGQIWTIGAEMNAGYRNGDSPIYQWDDQGKWRKMNYPAAAFIAATSVGGLFVARNDGSIYQLVESTWKKAPGKITTSISSGSDAVWLAGEVNGVTGIYEWNYEQSNWVKVEGEASEIAVDPNGNPWIINDKDEILRLTGRPAAAAPATSTATAKEETSSEPAFEEEKIKFARGETDVTLEQTIAPGVNKTFLANARKGQIMWFKVTESTGKIEINFNKNPVKVGQEVRQVLNSSGEWAIYVDNPTNKPLKYSLWVGIE